MASKTYELKFDFNTKDVEIASDKVLGLKEQLRILQKELSSGNLSQEQFEILSKKLGDVQDGFQQTRARSQDFITSLQLIPGPIGEIASKFNGAIGLLKTFSAFKLDDIKFQIGETVNDIKEIGAWLGKATGITKIYTVLNNALASSFVKVGVGEAAAAAGARAFSAALVATGVGALVVGLGLAITALMDFADTSDEAEQQQKELADSIERVNQLLSMDLADMSRTQKERLAQMRVNGATEKQIRDRNVEDLKQNLQITQVALEENYALERKAMAENTGNLKEVFDQQRQLEEKRDQLISDIRVANLENIRQTNEEIKNEGHKRQQEAEKLAQQQKQFEENILRQRKESLDVQIENEKNSATTSQEVLTQLYQKRNKLDLDELKRAELVAKTQRDNGQINLTEYTDIIRGIEAKRVKLATETTKAIETALEDDKKVEQERIKNQEDFNNKIRDLRASAIVDETEREKQQRKNKYDDDLLALERDKEFIAKSETEKAEIRKLLLTQFNNDINKINETQNKKEREDALKAFDDRLRILELQSQGLLQGTRAYFQNREMILKETEAKELEQLKLDLQEKKITQEDYEKAVTATYQKYANLRKQLKQDELAAIGQTISATFSALGGLTNALAESYDEEAKTSEEAFNKRKKLQVATAVMSAASGLVQILTQPSTLPSPFDWIVKGINAAALAVATGVNISKIKKTTFEAPDAGGEGQSAEPYKVTARRASGGIVRGAGTSTSDSINARLSNGEYVVNARATSAYLPLLNAINDAGLQPRFAMGGLVTGDKGFNTAETISSAIASGMAERPIRTYVVGQDMSNQQQFDRTIKSRSLL